MVHAMKCWARYPGYVPVQISYPCLLLFPLLVVIFTFLLHVSYFRLGAEAKVLPQSQQVVQFSSPCCSNLVFSSSADYAHTQAQIGRISSAALILLYFVLAVPRKPFWISWRCMCELQLWWCEVEIEPKTTWREIKWIGLFPLMSISSLIWVNKVSEEKALFYCIFMKYVVKWGSGICFLLLLH